MAGILSNGSYVLQPSTSADFYDYVMYDADGNFAEGIKRGDGNYSYGFQRHYTTAAPSAAYQIVPKYVVLKELNDEATATVSLCSGNRFLERVEGHFNNVTHAQYMFSNCSALQYIPDNSFNNLISGLYFFQNCSSLKEVPSNSFNNIKSSNGFANGFSNTYSLSSWGSNTFNSMTGSVGFIPSSPTAMKNIDGWATSFEMASGLAGLTANSYSSYGSVTSNLIPIIEHFKNKTVPFQAVYTAHMFKWFTGAADYNVCTASPIYSGWVL